MGDHCPRIDEWALPGLDEDCIGHVVNTSILAIVYFIVITPMGMVMRIMGKDAMTRTLDDKLESYRVISKARNPNHTERPF